ATYNFAPSRSNQTDKFDLRVDHRFSAADALASSYSLNQTGTYTPGQFDANGGGYLGVGEERWGLNEDANIHPALINEFRLGYVRTRFFNFLALENIQSGLASVNQRRLWNI